VEFNVPRHFPAQVAAVFNVQQRGQAKMAVESSVQPRAPDKTVAGFNVRLQGPGKMVVEYGRIDPERAPVKAAAANNGDLATGPIIAPIASPIATAGIIGGKTISPTSITIGTIIGMITITGSTTIGAITIIATFRTIQTSITGAGQRGRR
jgi:hypothetical protein